jgi:hypothetical protein
MTFTLHGHEVVYGFAYRCMIKLITLNEKKYFSGGKILSHSLTPSPLQLERGAH